MWGGAALLAIRFGSELSALSPHTLLGTRARLQTLVALCWASKNIRKNFNYDVIFK